MTKPTTTQRDSRLTARRFPSSFVSKTRTGDGEDKAYRGETTEQEQTEQESRQDKTRRRSWIYYSCRSPREEGKITNKNKSNHQNKFHKKNKNKSKNMHKQSTSTRTTTTELHWRGLLPFADQSWAVHGYIACSTPPTWPKRLERQLIITRLQGLKRKREKTQRKLQKSVTCLFFQGKIPTRYYTIRLKYLVPGTWYAPIRGMCHNLPGTQYRMISYREYRAISYHGHGMTYHIDLISYHIISDHLNPHIIPTHPNPYHISCHIL